MIDSNKNILFKADEIPLLDLKICGKNIHSQKAACTVKINKSTF